MKLKIFGYEDINFSRDYTTFLVIEDKKLYSHLILSLSNYENNKSIDDEILILNDNDEIIKGSQIRIIVDPINLNFNEKSIIKKIYESINQNILNQVELFDQFHRSINFLNSIVINELNDYNFEFNSNYEISIIDYLKCLNIKIEIEDDKTIFERLLDYIEIYSELFPNQIIFFIGIVQYLDDKQVEEINKYICYKKITCIFLENTLDYDDYHKKYIIDSDFYLQIY